MKNIKDYRIEIITGQYNTADPQQKALINHLLGDQAQSRFETYFHWYNIVHELGHAVIEWNSEVPLHPAEEEQLVNDFAVAYWRQYGEEAKIKDLCEIVSGALSRFTVPDERMDYMEYAKQTWGKKELYTFDHYGWFQFSCVQHSLSEHKVLRQLLSEMGVSGVESQEKRTLQYIADENMPNKVANDAVRILRGWGAALPESVKIIFSEDPNCHMYQAVRKNSAVDQ